MIICPISKDEKNQQIILYIQRNQSKKLINAEIDGARGYKKTTTIAHPAPPSISPQIANKTVRAIKGHQHNKNKKFRRIGSFAELSVAI
jgi:hypothetical protein